MNSGMTFDKILSERIQLGAFQIRTFMIVSFIDFLDGAEVMYVTLLNTILYKEWGLSIFDLILLGGVFNFGLFIGSLICAIYADRIGRRNILVFGCAIQVFLKQIISFPVCCNFVDSFCLNFGLDAHTQILLRNHVWPFSTNQPYSDDRNNSDGLKRQIFGAALSHVRIWENMDTALGFHLPNLSIRRQLESYCTN